MRDIEIVRVGLNADEYMDIYGEFERKQKDGHDALSRIVAALEAIRDLPSETDLLANAEARAMYEIDRAALASAGEDA